MIMYSNGFPTKPRLLFGAMLMAQRSSSFEICRERGRGLLLDGSPVRGRGTEGNVSVASLVLRWSKKLPSYVTVGVLDEVGR